MLRHALPFFDELTQVYELKRDGANEPVLYALARAIAKAGDGAVLNYIPVTAPPRFELIFDERGATNMSWADVLAQLRERIDKK